jgi:polar amino acid transport system ATP-binding protein
LFDLFEPIGKPSKVTEPLSGGVSQLAVLKRVLLPQPLGPIKHTTSPFFILKLISSKAVIEPKVVVIKMLHDVGLEDKIYDWPDNLSGGQMQRLAIARALAMDPVLMLFDEPTSALDPELVSEVLNVLRRLADDGMTMIIVTHELGFASQVADRVAFMENGKIIEEGPPNEILKTPKTQRLRLFLDKLNITAFTNQ